MIRYNLVDSAGALTEWDDPTLKLLSDDFEVEIETVEKSFRAGADFPGVQRDASKEFSLVYDIHYNNDADFRDAVNSLTYSLRKTAKIRDVVLSVETAAYYTGQSIAYYSGGQLRGATITINFKQLRPFWEDLTYTSVSASSTLSTTLTPNNLGFVEAPAIVTVTALAALTKFSFKVTETGQGVIITDSQFGASGLTEFIIDTKAGTFELEGVDRKSTVASGTGPFNIPVGNSNVVFQSSALANIELKWKRRYYI